MFEKVVGISGEVIGQHSHVFNAGGVGVVDQAVVVVTMVVVVWDEGEAGVEGLMVGVFGGGFRLRAAVSVHRGVLSGGEEYTIATLHEIVTPTREKSCKVIYGVLMLEFIYSIGDRFKYNLILKILERERDEKIRDSF